MATMDEIRHRINTDSKYVHIKKFEFNIDRVLDRYPDGAPNKVIAQGLQMTEEEVEETWQRIVLKLREAMKIEL